MMGIGWRAVVRLEGSHNSRHKITMRQDIPRERERQRERRSGEDPLLERSKSADDRRGCRCGSRRWSVNSRNTISLHLGLRQLATFVHGIGQDTVLPLRRTTTVTTTTTKTAMTTTTATYDGGEKALSSSAFESLTEEEPKLTRVCGSRETLSPSPSGAGGGALLRPRASD